MADKIEQSFYSVEFERLRLSLSNKNFRIFDSCLLVYDIRVLLVFVAMLFLLTKVAVVFFI